jgi:CBS domain containing-hemolysin-like protein
MILLYLSGWFSGSETAITKLSPAQIAEMEESGDKNIKHILYLKKHMDRTLVTILIGNNIVNIALSAIATLIANDLFHTIGVSIAVGIMTFLIVVFGEITPKSFAILHNAKVSRSHSIVLYYLMKIFSPIISFFIFISEKIMRFIDKSPPPASLLISDESIKHLATMGEEEGVIKEIERKIIHKVFNFGDRKIEDVMVPMEEVFFLDKNCTIAEASEKIGVKGFTRIPVIIDGKVRGLLYSKELIGKNGNGYISDLISPPFLVTLNQDITEIFEEMKEKRIHMAIVTDESGKHIGLVTLEDILEELVGDIKDEYSEQKKMEIENAQTHLREI